MDQSVGSGEAGEFLSVEATHTPVGGEPQVSLAIFQQGVYRVVDQSVGGGVGGELNAVEAADPAVVRPAGGEPQMAFPVLQDVDDGVGQAVLDAVAAPQALAETGPGRQGLARTCRSRVQVEAVAEILSGAGEIEPGFCGTQGRLPRRVAL